MFVVAEGKGSLTQTTVPAESSWGGAPGHSRGRGTPSSRQTEAC